MSPLDALNQIKQLFAEAEPVVANNQPVAAAKEWALADGSKIYVEILEIGQPVFVKDANGNDVPAPVGEYQLADGIKITVSETGQIAEISNESNEPVEPAQPVVDQNMAETIANLESQIANLKTTLAEQQRFANENSEKFAKSIHDLADIVQKFMTTPSSDPIQQPANAFSKHVEPKADKIEKFLERVKKISSN